MKVNKIFITERLDDGSIILLDPQKEVIFILNKTGYCVLDTADNHEKEHAKSLYFDKMNLPMKEIYLNDYERCLSQLIENGILLEA